MNTPYRAHVENEVRACFGALMREAMEPAFLDEIINEILQQFSKMLRNVDILEFHERVDPAHSLPPDASELGYFMWLFTIDMITRLVNNEQSQAARGVRDSAWQPTTVEETRAYICLNILIFDHVKDEYIYDLFDGETDGFRHTFMLVKALAWDNDWLSNLFGESDEARFEGSHPDWVTDSGRYLMKMVHNCSSNRQIGIPETVI